MEETKKVAGTLMEYGGKLLLLLRTDGTWGLPAGGVEPGEDELSAAAREMFEETGYRAEKKDLRMLFVYDKPLRSTKNKRPVILTIYRLTLPRLIKVRLDPNEHTDFRWLTPQEAIELPNTISGLPEVFKKAYGLG